MDDEPLLKEQLYKCSKCGYCRDTISDELGFYHICPSYDILRLEPYCGRGRTTIALGLLEGIIPFSTNSFNVFYTCFTCGECKEICPENIDVPAIVKAARKELFKHGIEHPKLKKMNLMIKDTHNLFGEAKPKSKWAKDLNLPKNGEVLYFAGCSASYTYSKIAKAAAKILLEAKLNVAYLGEDEWCCGAPTLWAGNDKLFNEIMKHNVSEIKTSGAKKIIFSCPVCYNTFKQYYTKEISKISLELSHISEEIAELMGMEKIKPTKPIKKRITYHDPCYLGRSEKIYEQPRDVIKRIPQLEYLEMPRNRKSALCCGEGIVVSKIFPELTSKISVNRIDEAMQIGAQAIVTCCPGCVTTLSKASAQLKFKRKVEIDVYDLTEIVAEALNFKL
ncbi:MAG: (Fe-S)-binding protein [Candidatus Bathyarchaeia archaeon]